MRASDNPAPAGAYVVDPKVRIGHVHLKVADLRRALDFYSGVLGLEIMQRMGKGRLFLSAGGYPHHIPLQHMGESGRIASGGGKRPGFITRQLLSYAGGASDCTAQSAGSENSHSRRGGPRRQRIDLSE